MYTISEAYPLTIDRTRSLEQMIAAGRYDWVNEDITTERFPVSGTGVREAAAFLVQFNRIVSADEILAALHRLNLRPGPIVELLAFGAQYPCIQRQFPVIELGSVWKHRAGPRHVASLYGGAAERGLGLGWVGDGWRAYCRFLAFRKF